MRKWLIILALLSVAILATLWWLGNSMNAHKPEPGEVRMEIEHVLLGGADGVGRALDQRSQPGRGAN